MAGFCAWWWAATGLVATSVAFFGTALVRIDVLSGSDASPIVSAAGGLVPVSVWAGVGWLITRGGQATVRRVADHHLIHS